MRPLYTCMWNSITTGRVGVGVGMEVGVGGAVTAPHVSPVVDEPSLHVHVELDHHGAGGSGGGDGGRGGWGGDSATCITCSR